MDEALVKDRPEAPQNGAVAREELLCALAEDRAARVAACQVEVFEALKRHGCSFHAEPRITPDGRIVVTEIRLVAQ